MDTHYYKKFEIVDKTKNIGRDIHISRDFNGEKSCSPKTSFE